MEKDCIFCSPERFGERKLEFEDEEGFWYLVVPKEVGSFGQVLLVVRKRPEDNRHITDISDPEMLLNRKRLLSVMNGISYVANKLKYGLKDQVERNVEKVYVVTQCEGTQTHLHFQLYPRYQGDLSHTEFLYACELEETKWQDPPKVPLIERIETGRQILQRYSDAVTERQGLYSEDYKIRAMRDILLKLNQAFREE
jgi:diadenosine tetraphosphate (Ap4A) HIT family hydrolase